MSNLYKIKDDLSPPWYDKGNYTKGKIYKAIESRYGPQHGLEIPSNNGLILVSTTNFIKVIPNNIIGGELL